MSDFDLESLLAGELDAAALAELEAKLRADPQFLREAMEAYRLRQLLPLALRGRGGDRFAEAVCRSIGPSGDGFVTRVEKSVHRRVAKRRRRSGLWLLPLAAAAAVIALSVILRWPTPPAPPAAAAASALATVDDDLPVVAAAGGPLKLGELVAIGRDLAMPAASSATLRWRDGSTLSLAGGTRARLARALGKRVELDCGRVDCSAAHQPEGRPLAIATPHGEATIVGTRFTLEVAATTLLRVSEGAVRLRGRDGVDALVHAGEERRVGPSPPLYAQDFLTGLPAGWQCGELVEENAGAWWRSVAASEHPDGVKPSWCISSEQRRHEHPFFRFDRGATVELTIAQQQPAPELLLLVLCRADTGAYLANVLLHVDVPDRPDWQTLRLPLAKAFQGLDQVGDVPAVCTSWVLQSFERGQQPRLARIAVLTP